MQGLIIQVQDLDLNRRSKKRKISTLIKEEISTYTEVSFTPQCLKLIHLAVQDYLDEIIQQSAKYAKYANRAITREDIQAAIFPCYTE